MQDEVKVSQADEAKALEVFNDALGDMGSFAEFGRPSYQDGALRTIAVHLARHRHQAERDTLAGMEPVAFQKGVDQWMDVCFGEAIKADKVERCDRFIEEALEFVQSVGYSAERAHALVDYVFNRDIGEVNQEVGGVMVTLAAACNTIGVDIASAAQTELARVWTKVDAIRAKQAAKPTGSALPIALPTAPEAGQ